MFPVFCHLIRTRNWEGAAKLIAPHAATDTSDLVAWLSESENTWPDRDQDFPSPQEVALEFDYNHFDSPLGYDEYCHRLADLRQTEED